MNLQSIAIYFSIFLILTANCQESSTGGYGGYKRGPRNYGQHHGYSANRNGAGYGRVTSTTIATTTVAETETTTPSADYSEPTNTQSTMKADDDYISMENEEA